MTWKPLHLRSWNQTFLLDDQNDESVIKINENNLLSWLKKAGEVIYLT